MEKTLALQFLALSLYVLFTGFCFCDGFGVPTSAKLLWGVVLLSVSLAVLKTRGEFDLSLILPVPTLFSLLLCYRRKKRIKQ